MKMKIKYMIKKIILGILILSLFCHFLSSGFSSSQVVVNSKDWRDVYICGCFASLMNLSFSFFNERNDVFDVLYLLDKSENDLILVESQSDNFGNFVLSPSFNIANSSKSDVTNNSLFLTRLGNFSKFFLLNNNSPENAISIIPMLINENIFPIFLNENNSKDIFLFLNKINESKDIELFYFNEFSNDLILEFLKFDRNVFVDRGKFGNNVFVIERLKNYGINISNVIFLGEEVIERELFSSLLPIVFVPNILTSNFIDELDNLGIYEGYSVGNYSFEVMKKLVLNYSRDIVFKFKELKINPNSMENSGEYRIIKELDLVEIDNLFVGVRIFDISITDNQINFFVENIGNDEIFYNMDISFYNNGNFLFSRNVSKLDKELDINSIRKEIVDILKLSDVNITVNFSVLFTEHNDNILDNYYNLVEYIYVPNAENVLNQNFNYGRRKKINDLGNEIKKIEFENILNLLGVNLSYEDFIDKANLFLNDYYYENYLLDKKALKELFENEEISEKDYHLVLNLDKSFLNIIFDIKTDFKVLDVSGIENSNENKITSASIKLSQFEINENNIGKILRVVVVIPKDVILSIKEISGNFKVLADDPIIIFETEITEENINNLDANFNYVFLGDKSELVHNIKTYYEISNNNYFFDKQKINLDLNYETEIKDLILEKFKIKKEELIEFEVLDLNTRNKIYPQLDILNFLNLEKNINDYGNLIEWILDKSKFDVLFKKVDEKFTKVKLKLIDGDERFFIVVDKSFNSNIHKKDILNVAEVFSNNFEREVKGNFKNFKNEPDILIFNLEKHQSDYSFKYVIETFGELEVVKSVGSILLNREENVALNNYIINYEIYDYFLIFLFVSFITIILIFIVNLAKDRDKSISKEFTEKMKLIRNKKRGYKKVLNSYKKK